mmetsp:Transcript_15821/g.23519  ORF Transcript_15821/g.23519 Transcript_15821/m.23519 type:complete len:108 (-) Transcript_15821:88-411(-)|eukprot:CAMPEP_0171454414 /NCGR_PEP_ID=MMETSP0945-20130129/1705_1 /TAXON_ID=109269 /ORGANISM="Vaucheria litorea, Strain CCMP2940" /LENGTH=107 /DNA_ID=CAMNT_0011979423 /DNA_START=52 /DNA_END=375 /DNA_ORIENTATION=+
MVKMIESADEFNALIAEGGKVVVDCFAEWCGPCKRIAPFVAELEEKNSDVTFIKIDVDELDELAQKLSISAMPTFIFFSGGKEVEELRMVGASNEKLESTVAQLKAK